MNRQLKVIKIPEIEAIRENANVWFGLHKKHGWVVFNREYQDYYFVKCANWKIYIENRENWIKTIDPDYLYYARYLALIPNVDLENEKKRAVSLVNKYINKKNQIDSEIENIIETEKNIIETKKRKAIEDEKRKLDEQIRRREEEAKEHTRLEELKLEKIRKEKIEKRKYEIDNIITKLKNQLHTDHDDIKNILADKSIRGLVHFTKLTNISSIISHGLLPKSELLNTTYQYNDIHRLDGFPEAVCLSISYPNYRMFFKYRKLNRNEKWLIIVVSEDIVATKPCMFFKTNAASSDSQILSRDYSKTIMGKKGLLCMFDEEVSGQRRIDLGIPDKYTTNPEAEILVFNKIEPQFFKMIIMEEEDDSILETIKSLDPTLQVMVNKEGFKPRTDYVHWKRNANRNSDESFDEMY